MPNPPRRPFFQIHLSTAIVLMFSAGALIWINTHARMPYKCCIYDYGWPFTALERELTHNGLGKADTWSYEIFYLNMAIDVCTAQTILLAVRYLCERRIRRRAARTES